ncbi:sensor histidine kinase [Cohnella endophytica]|uniref:Sensor histidine kinase n=1 Tax=Cohnella endophytica TaxID=2419778 RepID=A0A494XPD7_9BACL|nr:sensor histidine kinase [Cohnella endophytica]RKP49989.1 sensor histidine kinase [Cohnella endophytica]
MRRISIRLRLMVLMIGLTALPVVTMTWIGTTNTRQSVEKELIGANESRMMWADQYLNELIEQIDMMFVTLQINEQLMENWGIDTSGGSDLGTQVQSHNVIRDAVTSVFYANTRKIDFLTLYSHSSKRTFSVSYADSGSISKLDIRAGAWSRMEKGPIGMYFKQEDDGIYAFHGINRFSDRRLQGGISLRIKKDVWKEVSNILQSEAESSVFLLNDEGELLSGSTKTIASAEVVDRLNRLDLKDSRLDFRRTDEYFYFAKKIGDGQLTVVKVIPVRNVTQSAKPTIRAGFLTGSLFAAASILLSVLVSLRISRPIVSLARTMRMAPIQSFETKSVNSHDEIGLLQHGYNSMIQRIKELIENGYQREIQVKNAQLKALQAQINPHFLNNTLHLIGGMALAKDAPEIYRITRVIGDLLRYSISTDDDVVPLQQELTHMRNYLFIQELRFTGRCTANVTIDESALACKLPKFTLQPIVENAFEHGLQRKEGKWALEVRVKRIGGRIALLVKDEGVGMTAERLNALREEMNGGVSRASGDEARNGPKSRKGIGLLNVDSRLKLQFGERYGVRLFSNAGTGTLVVILLPSESVGGNGNGI